MRVIIKQYIGRISVFSAVVGYGYGYSYGYMVAYAFCALCVADLFSASLKVHRVQYLTSHGILMTTQHDQMPLPGPFGMCCYLKTNIP